MVEISCDGPPQRIAEELHAEASRFLTVEDLGCPPFGSNAATTVWDTPDTTSVLGIPVPAAVPRAQWT